MAKVGYIKFYKSILDWKWYKDAPTKVIFIHCLLKANWKNETFQGIDVPRGSFVSSLTQLSEETGLSRQSVRTAIAHLKSTQELTQTSTQGLHGKLSVYSIQNYDKYQGINTRSNTKNGTTIDTYTKEEDKNIKNRLYYTSTNYRNNKKKIKQNFDQRTDDLDTKLLERLNERFG